MILVTQAKIRGAKKKFKTIYFKSVVYPSDRSHAGY